MTPEQFQQCMTCTPAQTSRFYVPLSQAMNAFGICTPERKAAFLAQVCVESGDLEYVKEIWGPTPAQLRYDPPGELAMRLGNTKPGMGKLYMGRGLIETTGLYNYQLVSKALAHDFVNHPDDLCQPIWASRSAAYYFKSHGCNELADQFRFGDITREINGGMTEQALRIKAWTRCKNVLGV